jgi:hydrogenase maturation protease
MMLRPLVLAWGNPARVDDGLGWRFGETLLRRAPRHVDVRIDFQLQIEDCLHVRGRPAVLFVDASACGPAPFRLEPISSGPRPTFRSHHVAPQEILGLAVEIYGPAPPAWLLAIRGYEFDRFDEDLSARAELNLRAAVEDVLPALVRNRLGDLESRPTLARPIVPGREQR